MVGDETHEIGTERNGGGGELGPIVAMPWDLLDRCHEVNQCLDLLNRHIMTAVVRCSLQ